MLHNEARELLVAGYEKTHDARQIAMIFGVSTWQVYHLSAQKRKTGSVALKTSQRGRKPLLNDEDKRRIRKCIDEMPDITIRELREKLHLKASYPTVARVVHRMGYTVKKKSLHASEQERPRCAGKESRMEKENLER